MSTTLPPTPHDVPEPGGTVPPAIPPQGKGPAEHDGFAIASLVTAFLMPILGIIFGHLSNHRAKLAHRAKSGLAIAGLVLGYLFTGISALIIVLAVAVSSSTPSVSAAPPAPPSSSGQGLSNSLQQAQDCTNSGGTWNGTSCDTQAPASTPAAPASPANTGPLGSQYQVTNSDGTAYTVTATSIQDPASLTQYESLKTYTDHMIAVQLTITGNAGQASDDVNSDMTVIGSDGQVYQPSYNDTTAGTNFDSGEFRVGPGQMVRGVVNFELPHGVTVQSLQWSPGLDGPTATWTVAG
jgi:hypothetical protein